MTAVTFVVAVVVITIVVVAVVVVFHRVLQISAAHPRCDRRRL